MAAALADLSDSPRAKKSGAGAASTPKSKQEMNVSYKALRAAVVRKSVNRKSPKVGPGADPPPSPVIPCTSCKAPPPPDLHSDAQ